MDGSTEAIVPIRRGALLPRSLLGRALLLALLGVAAAVGGRWAGTSAEPLRAPSATRPGEVRLPASLPLRRDEPAPGPGLGPLRSAGLAVALAALFGGAILLRGRGATSGRPAARLRWPAWLGLQAGATTRPMRVVQSQRLTPRASLHVVEWDGREWLVGCSEQGISLVAQGSAGSGPGRAPSGAPVGSP
jgi:hypothetical protein